MKAIEARETLLTGRTGQTGTYTWIACLPQSIGEVSVWALGKTGSLKKVGIRLASKTVCGRGAGETRRLTFKALLVVCIRVCARGAGVKAGAG